MSCCSLEKFISSSLLGNIHTEKTFVIEKKLDGTLSQFSVNIFNVNTEL